VKSWPHKVVMLQVNSTYSTTKLPRKILLNRLVEDYSPWFSEYLQLLLSLRPRFIFSLVNDFPMMTYFGTL
jgi:hypothetical protein